MLYKTPNLVTGKEHFGGAQYALSHFGLDTKVTIYTGVIALVVNLLVTFVVTRVRARPASCRTRPTPARLRARGRRPRRRAARARRGGGGGDARAVGTLKKSPAGAWERR